MIRYRNFIFTNFSIKKCNINSSYQWDKQELVREIYEDFHMRKVQTWFDIWGSMQGSTNDAMATGLSAC
jgi:hypothetical protein